MPTTTVLNDDSATIVSNDTAADAGKRRFSWSAAFAGAFVATAVTFFLLTLGSGVGLSLVSVRGATTSGTTTFLTLGAIYFLAAQAFGFAAGGHLAGRLIGPAIETSREEEFRAGAHGLVVWALTVVATATLLAISALVAGSAASQGAMMGSLSSRSAPSSSAATPAVMAYWVDDLFRAPPTAQQASLSGWQFAQADTGNQTDATQQPSQGNEPQSGQASGSTTAGPDDEAPTKSTNAPSPDANNPGPGSSDTANPATPNANSQPAQSGSRSIDGDKAEVGRILSVDMKSGGMPSKDDRDQIARLVSQDAGLTFPAAQSRVDDVTARIHDNQVKAAETARKAASYLALWTALALLFGAVVATAAAISARWEDDKQSLMPSWSRRAPV